jgi:CheY-like chemotaxis protein
MSTKKKILIVEDGDFSVKLYTHLLEDEGYEVVSTPRADQAAKLTEEHSPALIIMDLMLQHGNGFAAIADIRKNPKFNKIPIVVLSNLSQEADVKEALAKGANKYMVKSNVRFQKVVETINEMVKK